MVQNPHHHPRHHPVLLHSLQQDYLEEKVTRASDLSGRGGEESLRIVILNGVKNLMIYNQLDPSPTSWDQYDNLVEHQFCL